MNLLMGDTNRDEHLHIRIKPDIKEHLKILADMRGLTMSGLVQHLIVKAIREGKTEDPAAFQVTIAVGQAILTEELVGGRPMAKSSKKKIPTRKVNTNTKAKRSA